MKDHSPGVSTLLIATFALLAATLGAAKLAANRITERLSQPLDGVARSLAGFTGADNPKPSEPTLRALKCDAYLTRTYRKTGLSADVFVAYYAQQRAGESMHSPKHCLPGAGWEIWDYGRTGIPLANTKIEVNQYSISRESERMVVLYWYQSRNRIIASEYLGKILLARDTLLQNSTAASIVRIVVHAQPSAVEEARSLASALIPELQRCYGN